MTYEWQPPRKQDPERPSAPSRSVAGREKDAEVARAARDALLRLTRGDDRLRGEIERALIVAGVLEVDR